MIGLRYGSSSSAQRGKQPGQAVRSLISTAVGSGHLWRAYTLAQGSASPPGWRCGHLWDGGAKAGELPIQRPIKFDLVINLTTAKVLGLDVPLFLQQRADEVIE